MNKKWSTLTITVLLLVFAGYILLDKVLSKKAPPVASAKTETAGNADQWIISNVFEPGIGQLNAVSVGKSGNLLLGGETFVACYDPGFKLLWEYNTEMPVTALTVTEDNIYASVQGTILVLNLDGQLKEEWGPFENNSMITSLAANEAYIAFADAANKTVFVLDKNGNVRSIIGRTGEPFIIPSYYFDVAFGAGDNLYIANPGQRRIESRNIDGVILDSFGEPGTGPDAFCGCCNPSHFALVSSGFVTAEKGINRIKILNESGKFVEFVSSENNFVPPLPLDIASSDNGLIYGVNPADSKLYVFSRK